MSGMEASAAFAPLLPWSALAPLAAATALVLGYAAFVRASGLGWRLLAAAVLLLTLANPSLVLEQREALPDIAIAVVDESPSQDIGQRRRQAETALASLRAAVERFPDLELRVVRAGNGRGGGDGTELFGDLGRALSELPERRLAGIVMITDGQIHDVPDKPADRARYSPFHALIAGDRNRGDRRLVVVQAPIYGLVGKPLEMTVRVDDLPVGGGMARIDVRRDGKPWRALRVPVGRERKVEIQLDHAGTTYFELEVEAVPGELSSANNTAVVAVNGVRDRLRVLLISGEPHPGERSWRNLLKSDPAVDLVHFTILRPPEKQDRTPVDELSLISFPTRELFEARLDEFDLIIFDRYRRRGVILSRYIGNVAQYVERGGALLVAVGPAFATPLSLYRTPLQSILPGRPTGDVKVGGFRAKVAAKGLRHPVTADLPGVTGKERRWGRWFRLIDVAVDRGDMLMTGAEGRPLLILDRVGEGRVAQFMSDQIWLWGRGFEGGGPQAELLRRLAHWLMKEPELEENDLRAEVRGGRLEVTRRSLLPDRGPVEITSPSEEVRTLELEDAGGGRATGSVAVESPGLYRVRDHGRSTLVAVGTLNPREVTDMRATDERLAPLIAASGGGTVWLAEETFPEIRRVRPGREIAGKNRLGQQGWVGLRANGDYIVTGIRQVPVLPGILVLVLALATLVLAWRREGR
ncbi:MAG: hypothetical protein ACTSXZ_01770 [Alphaproteobacteria bacterium]